MELAVEKGIPLSKRRVFGVKRIRRSRLLINEAIASGNKTYQSNKPCQAMGHIGPRYVATMKCVECESLRMKRYKEKHPLRAKQADLMRQRRYKYKLSQEQFDKMLAEQKGLCAVCGELLQVPFVDHCHETKRVRGLVCKHCNSGLGFFKDSSDILRRAAAYLERNSCRTF